MGIKTPNLILLIVGVIIVIYSLSFLLKVNEGFATLPTAPQSSMIPQDQPGATTNNPTVSLPQPKDIIAAQQELENLIKLEGFKRLDTHIKTELTSLTSKLKAALENPNASKLSQADLIEIRSALQMYTQVAMFGSSLPAARKDIVAAQQELENLLKIEGFQKLDVNQKLHAVFIDNKLKSALENTNESPLTQDMLIELQSGITSLTQIAKGKSTLPSPSEPVVVAPSSKTTVAATPSGQITLPEIENLRTRVDEERLRLANLRSENPNMLVRIAQLEKLSGDLGDIISAVQGNRLKLSDVPIKPETAQMFLRKLKDENNKLPLLISPLGTTQSKPNTITPSNVPPVPSSEGLQTLLTAAQALKWELEIKVGYDPEIAQRERILNELKSMEKRLIDLSISETPLTPTMQTAYMKKLETLQAMLQSKSTKQSKPSLPRLPTQTRIPSSEYSKPEFPTLNQLFEAQGSQFGPQAGTFPNGEISPDVYVRPGFPMTDSMIAHRGSAASYNESAVGGLDYKKRVQELCRQIKEAKLGDAKDFGCIANPSEVSSDYSWRGNYLMVCNRLGDTWGGWYPEMFGCPKYDPTSKFKGNMM